jgi:hypothetical protein
VSQRTIRHRVRQGGPPTSEAIQLGIVGWQAHKEAPAFRFILLVAGLAMVGFGKGFDDRQAQTCSLPRPGGWRISSGELGEKPGDERRRHSRTVVAYSELDEVSDSFSFDADGGSPYLTAFPR